MGEMKGKDYAYEEVQEAVNHERTKRAVVKRDLDAATEDLAKYKAVVEALHYDLKDQDPQGRRALEMVLEHHGLPIPESEDYDE
uniref:Host-nuclease inhibitor protein n=1 Tax=viral metagenome TaxID=1070528 RepID=A0A6M3LE43_9ZZZZ